MATPASLPDGTWASIVDDAITDIYTAHKADPAWNFTYLPAEGYAALDVHVPGLSTDQCKRAQQFHRRAQVNKPRTAGNRGPEGYRPRWLQYYSRRKGAWVITAYRGVGGKVTKLRSRNAASMLPFLLREMIDSFESDVLHEIMPTLDEHAAIGSDLRKCIMNEITKPLLARAKVVEDDVKTLSRVLTRAEQAGVSADLRACLSVTDMIFAYAEALLASGMEEEHVDSLLEEVQS